MTRVRLIFWSLVTVTIIAVGVLNSAWEAPSSAATGLRVAASGVVAALAAGVAIRIAIVTERRGQYGRLERASVEDMTPGRQHAPAADQPRRTAP